jgi:hypothetical protein
MSHGKFTRQNNGARANYIQPGILILINYSGIGISKIVRATSEPYEDESIVDEWKDQIERYGL